MIDNINDLLFPNQNLSKLCLIIICFMYTNWMLSLTGCSEIVIRML